MITRPRSSTVKNSAVTAIQGCAGSYSHEAAERAFGPAVRILECRTFGETLEALGEGRATSAILPIENSIVGPLPAIRELLAHALVDETGRVEVDVEHCLVVSSALRARQRIRRVASHPAALAQCRRFLGAHSDWTALPTEDTAGAVRALAAGRLEAEAAIASARAARLYGCRVIRRGIQDEAANVTSFAVLERATRATARPPGRTARGPCSPSAPPR